MVICSSCGQTAGERIRFDVSVEGTTQSGGSVNTFSGRNGFEVSLTRAELSFGPMLVRGPIQEEPSQLASWFLPTVAYAHPADDSYGRAPILGEILNQHPIDLLAGPQVIEEAVGILGTVESMDIELLPWGSLPRLDAPQSITNLNEGTTAYFEGVARRDALEIPFVASLNLPESDAARVVQDIPTATRLESSGGLVVNLYVDTWFQNVDFAPLAASSTNTVDIDPSSDAGFALVQGMRARTAYQTAWNASTIGESNE